MDKKKKPTIETKNETKMWPEHKGASIVFISYVKHFVTLCCKANKVNEMY